jgi:hypothetical protein
MSHSEETLDGHDSDNEDRRYPVGNDFDFHRKGGNHRPANFE